MKLMDDSLFEGERYQVLRLVMVNSGSSAYVELPLDQTSALLGSNNQGKTSGLHTLKLFLLPEVNFRNCESKFGFASKDREYTGLESYRYYFPDPGSFIILEASNPRGEFCIVLHQSNQELGYSRLAVPRPYDHIRHLFWDSNSRDNQGAGTHPDDMELGAVISRLKKLGARPLNDVASIREALYTRVNPANDDTRFCLMPLVQAPSQHMMRSIKALLQLSFDIKGADHKNLPQAIANIIDADLATQKETISIDFRKIQDDRERLSHNHREIRAIREHMDDWNTLRKNYLAYQEHNSTLRKGYRSLLAAHAVHTETIDPQLESARDEYETANLHYRQNHSQLKEWKSVYDQSKGQQKALEKDVSGLQEAITLADDVIAREAPVVGSDSPDDVQAHLQECLTEAEQELAALRDQERARSALEQELRRKPELKRQIEQAENVLTHQKSSTLSYFNAHTALVLNSLNIGFGEMVVEPDDNEINTVQAFAELFAENDQSRITFCQEAIPGVKARQFDALAVKETQASRLHKLEDELQSCERKISEFHRSLSGSDEQRQQSVKDKQTEITEIQTELRAISGLDYKRSDLEQKQQELEALTLQLEEQEQRQQALKDKLQELRNTREQCEERQKGLESQKKSLHHADQALKKLASVAGLQQLNPADEAEAISPHDIYQSAEELSTLFHSEVSRVRDTCSEKFRILVGTGIASLDQQLAFRADLTGHDFFDAYQKLRAEFDNIDSRERDHRAQVMNHNHDTGRQISLLDKMDLAIRNFQDRINEELSHIRISNLSGVRVEIGTLESFNTLRRELKDHGTESEQLMKDSFYNRLQDFCERYLMTGHNAGRLDLERIIKNVKFIYQINGQDEVTPQSNGTSSMVNAVLLSILMHKLVPEDVVLALPVIFDEVGSLDDSNLAELRRIVEEHNFASAGCQPDQPGQYRPAYRHLARPVPAPGNRWGSYRKVPGDLYRQY